MNSKLLTMVLALSLFLVPAQYAFAQSEQSVSTNKAVEVGNKVCPVSGEKVGQMGDIVKYEYNGKIYNLCCKACMKDFKKNPEKYSKIAEDQAKAQEEQEMSGGEGMGQHDHSGHDHSK